MPDARAWLYQRDRFVFGDGAEEIAQRRAAKSERIAPQPRLQPCVEHAAIAHWLLSWRYRIVQIPGRSPSRVRIACQRREVFTSPTKAT